MKRRLPRHNSPLPCGRQLKNKVEQRLSAPNELLVLLNDAEQFCSLTPSAFIPLESDHEMTIGPILGDGLTTWDKSLLPMDDIEDLSMTNCPHVSRADSEVGGVPLVAGVNSIEKTEQGLLSSGGATPTPT
ncbi:unnamed protein product [Ilex paraguariensis]|uniref:Uncharacterized protein n=1 Tax=Ilex paraguariensis TaxID=185542 RepID=A0ABC8UY91_9AQUA